MGSELLLPGPVRTLVALGGVIRSSRFVSTVGITALRITLGFLLGFSCAAIKKNIIKKLKIGKTYPVKITYVKNTITGSVKIKNDRPGSWPYREPKV